jgi:prepilin-type N-terminal cleavage/methylation domain-containing protein
MRQQRNMKKGITLIEIILAIVLIAVISGIAIPKLMSNSTQAEIKSTIVSDVKSITEAISLWRKSSATSNGVNRVLDVTEIRSRLPLNMQVDANLGVISSSGLATGESNDDEASFRNTGVVYSVWFNLTDEVAGLGDEAATTHDTSSFAIAIDTTFGAAELGWDIRMQEYALDIFQDAITDLAQRNSITTYDVGDVDARGGGTAITFTCANTGLTTRCFENILVQ